jgi:DNA repair exonuclease SbcCD ATPase subunit
MENIRFSVYSRPVRLEIAWSHRNGTTHVAALIVHPGPDYARPTELRVLAESVGDDGEEMFNGQVLLRQDCSGFLGSESEDEAMLLRTQLEIAEENYKNLKERAVDFESALKRVIEERDALLSGLKP